MARRMEKQGEVLIWCRNVLALHDKEWDQN